MNDGNANRIQGIRTLWLRQRVLYLPSKGWQSPSGSITNSSLQAAVKNNTRLMRVLL